MLQHTIVTGNLPEDSNGILQALNELSAEGFQVLSTTSAIDSTGVVRYAATLGKVIAQPAHQRSGIGMSGGGPVNKEPSNVDQNTAPQQECAPGS